MASDKALKALELERQGKTQQEIARLLGFSTLSGVRGSISKARRAAQPKGTVIELGNLREPDDKDLEIARLKARVAQLEDEVDPIRRVGKAWQFDGDWIIAGDIHLNTMNRLWAQQPLAIAKRHLKGKRRMLLAGDFLNMDAFSNYESDVASHAFSTEVAAGRDFLDMYLEVFDELWILLGNHDRRPGKRTKGTIKAEMVYQMIAPFSDRAHVSSWGWATIQAHTGTWRVTHGSNYSVNTLAVASNLAQKFQQHIIGHHQHHLAVGFDRYKRYLIIDNGGLFLEDHLLYTRLDDNTMPRMVNGFTMLKDGYPTVFGPPPFTDWRQWLDDEDVVKLEAA